MKDKFTLEQIIQFLCTVIPMIVLLTVNYINLTDKISRLECRQLESEKRNAQLKLLELKRELRDKVDNPDSMPYIQSNILDQEDIIKKVEVLYYNKCSNL